VSHHSHHESATTARELPGPLPPGERILWQDAPVWTSLFRSAFHGRTLAIYFGVLLLSRGATVLSQGGGAIKALLAMLWLTPLALTALGVLALIAWLTARQSYYTITDKRVVMRIGIVLEITFNFPFRVIESAGLRLNADGSGDLPLTLASGDHIAYLHLWPHARPWHFKQTQPMLRAIPNASAVADLLSRALVESSGGTAHAAAATQPVRNREPSLETAREPATQGGAVAMAR
jgi:hypothetical protein